jgi:hypothetical protein
VDGTIESGGSLTVNVPRTIILGLINGLTVTAENEDGSDPVVVGSAGFTAWTERKREYPDYDSACAYEKDADPKYLFHPWSEFKSRGRVHYRDARQLERKTQQPSIKIRPRRPSALAVRWDSIRECPRSFRSGASVQQGL